MKKQTLFAITLGLAISGILDKTKYNSMDFFQWWFLMFLCVIFGSSLYDRCK